MGAELGLTVCAVRGGPSLDTATADPARMLRRLMAPLLPPVAMATPCPPRLLCGGGRLDGGSLRSWVPEHEAGRSPHKVLLTRRRTFSEELGARRPLKMCFTLIFHSLFLETRNLWSRAGGGDVEGQGRLRLREGSSRGWALAQALAARPTTHTERTKAAPMMGRQPVPGSPCAGRGLHPGTGARFCERRT